VLWLRSACWLNPVKKVIMSFEEDVQNYSTYSCVVFHIFHNTLLDNTSYSEHCEELLAVSRVAPEFGNVKDNS